MQRRGTALFSLLVFATLSSPAAADDRWIVIEAREPNHDASPFAARARASLLAQHEEVVDEAEMRAVLDRRLLDTAHEIPAELRELFTRTAQQALEEVARGHNARTRELVSGVLARVGDLLPLIAREVRPRRDVGDLCLFAVRAHLNEHHPAEAHTAVVECLRMFPDLEPAPDLHPPEVRDLVEQARRDIAEGNSPQLVIASYPESVTDCPVFVNGTRVGQTPRVELRVVPGRHFVQIECASRRRVRGYWIDIPDRAESAIVVPMYPRLDASLQTEGDVRLEYSRAELTESQRIEDAAALRRVLHAANVIVVHGDGQNTMLTRLDSHDGGSADVLSSSAAEPNTETAATSASDAMTAPSVAPISFTLSNSASQEELDNAIAHLLSAEHQRDDDGDADWPSSPVGYTLGALGLAGLATDWVLYGVYSGHQHKLDVAYPMDADYATRVSNRNSWSTIVTVVGGGSSALLTAAMPFVLPRMQGMPWWSYVFGGAGIALATTGLILTANDNRHLADDQMHFERTVPLGPLLAMHAVPMLAIPLTYACRALFGDNASHTSASVTLDSRAVSLTVQGSF